MSQRTNFLFLLSATALFMVNSCHSTHCPAIQDNGITDTADSGDEYVDIPSESFHGPVDAPGDVFEEDLATTWDSTDLPAQRDQQADETGDMGDISQEDMRADVAADLADRCTDGAIDVEDCGGGAKKVRHCENGVWGPFSDCFDVVSGVVKTASQSKCASYSWRDRGRAPIGYMQGMALSFAAAVCHEKRSDIRVVSEAKTSDTAHDALAWYDNANIFADLGMSNDKPGIDTLRHAYTLLLGLGMRESSGRYCCGRDRSADNVTSNTAEAGLFQTSYNSHVFSAELVKLFNMWKARKLATPEKCLLDIFSQGVKCSAKDWENYGSGAGRDFQELEKKCPAFAAEYAAVMLRVSGGSKGHYGPLRRRTAEVRPECDAMFMKVQQVMQAHLDLCPYLPNY